VDKRLAPFWLPFGLRPSKDGVTITDDATFRATFGFLRMETPLTNVDEAHVTRKYRWWTAAGARGSWVDDGLTFGTNSNAGVCVHFRQPVPSPLRRKVIRRSQSPSPMSTVSPTGLRVDVRPVRLQYHVPDAPGRPTHGHAAIRAFDPSIGTACYPR